MQQASDVLLDALSVFIHKRQSGYNRDDAWFATLDEAKHLNEKYIKRLMHLAKNWEKREGHLYRGQASKHTTMLNPDNLPEELKAALAAQDNQPVIRPIQPPPKQAPPPVNADATSNLAPNEQSDPRSDPTYFGRNAKLLLYFRGVEKPLRYSIPDDVEFIIGRATPNSAMSADIDLTPINAGNYGVSRMHAALQRQDTNLLLMDLGALNQTLVNGNRVHPNEVKVLSDGDIIQLGRLEIGVRFLHQS
jgi:hypothetical protein